MNTLTEPPRRVPTKCPCFQRPSRVWYWRTVAGRLRRARRSSIHASRPPAGAGATISASYAASAMLR